MNKKKKTLIMLMMLSITVFQIHKISERVFANSQDISETNIQPVEEVVIEQNLTENQNSETSLMNDVAPASDFDYEKNGADEITITKYKGSAANLVIPETIDGYKVTELKGPLCYYSYSLKSVKIPNTVTSIGTNAFNSCSLESVEIPDSVIEIGQGAFGQTFLKSLTLPSSVKIIGDYAFSRTYLTSVTIEHSIDNIGNFIFSGCDQLESVNILDDSLTMIGTYMFKGCKNLKTISIGNSVKRIENGAFNEAGLTSVDIPDSVENIGDRSFDGCINLLSVKIGNSVKSIGQSAFKGCALLTEVDIPDSVENIGDEIFLGCSKLSSVKIGNSVKNIGKNAFKACVLLTQIDIPDSVESIGDGAFSGCTNLSTVKIGNSVKSIGDSAFSGCTNLSSVKIGNSVKSIGVAAFKSCQSLVTVDIPDSVENIMERAFLGCTNLSSVKIGNSVKNIGVAAFESCQSLVTVDIPDSVESIEIWAFSSCHNLSSVKIGNSVKSIGGEAFYDCTSLTSVVLPNTLTSLASNAFERSSVNKLVFICQDINDMNISVSDSIPENINVYRMAMNQEIKKAKENKIESYEFIGETILLKDLFEFESVESVIYDGATGTNQYEGSEIKIEDYFDMFVTPYVLVGDKTSNDTKIEDNQLYIGEDETSENLSIQVAHGEMNIQVPIQIIKAKSISIKEEPQNTYYENDTYNPEGLVLTMTYEDGYEKDIEYRADNDEITFEYQTVDMNITEQIIKYKGFEVKQSLTIYGRQTLIDDETKIEITGILTNNSSLKIEKIKDATTLYTLNSKEIIVGYDVQVIGEYKDKLTIVFDIGDEHNGKKAYIRHIKHDGSLEEFEETVSEGKVTVIVTELSPFVIYKDKEIVKEPNIDINHNVPSISTPEKPIIQPIQKSMIPTGDNSSILLWGVITMTSIATIIFIHKKYRL